MFNACSVILWDESSFHWDWVGDGKESEADRRVDHVEVFVVRISGELNSCVDIFYKMNVCVPHPKSSVQS